MGRPQMKIGCTRLGEAASCFWFMFLVLAGPSYCAETTSSGCAFWASSVSLGLACDPGQRITIDGMLVGSQTSQTSDCKVNKECDSPTATISQLPQVIACNGQRSCNVTLQLLVTCNISFQPNYAVELRYRCLRSSTYRISSEVFTTESTMSSTERNMSPTESTTGSPILPTESTTGSTMKPTESTSGNTLLTTKSTTESRTYASVNSVVVLLVLLVGVMVFTTLLVTCLLCVYRKPWKKDQSSIASSNTCTHLNHVSAPRDMTSGDENVVHMSSLENIGQMADSDHRPPLTVRQEHSAVKYSVSRVENGEGGCPGDSVYAQLDIPKRERDSADYWEVEVGKENSFCVVHSQVSREDIMLQEQTLQETSDTHHIAASPTHHPLRDLRTCEMGFAGSDTGDVFEESSIYEPLSNFNRLSLRRTDETYTFLEQQELTVQPDIQRTNKNYYFEIQPLYLKNESKAALDKLSYASETTENPYNHLSRTELRMTFTTDCDLQEQCEIFDSTHGRHDDHQIVTEEDEDNKSQDIRGRTGRNNRHDYFEIEAVRFPQYKDASVFPSRGSTRIY